MKSYNRRAFAYPQEDEKDARERNSPRFSNGDMVEVLMTDPPKLRVNGQIVPWPQNASPEEAYHAYLETNKAFNERENHLLLKEEWEDFQDGPARGAGPSHEEPSAPLHPLRKQYLESRLEQLDYAQRQQERQDEFTTRMYGRENYEEEREKILKELESDKQLREPGAKNSDEKSLGFSDRQTAKEKYPQTPPKVGEEISRFQREHPKEYDEYMKNMKDDAKTWQEINEDIRKGKTSPEKLSDAQWDNILENSAKELEEKKNQPNEKNPEPYCNIYARDRMLNDGIYMPPGQNANQMIDHMENHPELFEKLPKKKDADGNPTGKLDHDAAQKEAENGAKVFPTYRAPDNSEEHGHIGVLNPKAGMKSSRNWGRKLPSMDGYNPTAKCITEGESVAKQFSPPREPRMDYYKYIGPRRQRK